MACAAEWEKITGAFECERASIIVGTETCDKSTIIPKRFISFITSCVDEINDRKSGPK